MGRIVAAYQPRYYPRLHYLARAQQADVFVVYDDVQFSRGSPQHRAPIEYQDMEWLTVPVEHAGLDTTIDEARVDMSEPWPARHLKTLGGKYGKAAEELAPFYERLCLPIVDVESLRENADTVRARVDAEDVVDRCLEWEDRRLERKRALDDLRAEKRRVADEISERKRADPSADIDDLVADADAVDERLAGAEDAHREAKKRRDQALVELSERLDGDDAVERSSLNALWKLDGVDPEELLSDVGLVDLTIPLLRELFRRFEITSRVVRSSEVDVEPADDASEYLARLTEHLGGNSYLSGEVGYENYFDEAPFDARGIDVLVQDWTPEWDDGNVCALDVLFAAENPEVYVR